MKTDRVIDWSQPLLVATIIGSGVAGMWCVFKASGYRVQLSGIEDWSTTVLDELARAYMVAGVALWGWTALCLCIGALLCQVRHEQTRASTVIRWRNERLNEMRAPAPVRDDLQPRDYATGEVVIPGEDTDPPAWLKRGGAQ